MSNGTATTDVLLQIGLQIVLPAFLIVGLWRGRFASRSEWVFNVLVVSAILLFVFLTARWDFTSYYLRVVLPLLVVAAALVSFRRTKPADAERRKSRLVESAFSGVVFVVCLGLSAIALWGYRIPEDAIQLSYPLKGGTYYVGGGGNDRLINNHQVNESQKFALDIVRLNTLGNRASGLAPSDPGRYAIFSDTVYSPCSGNVVRAVDGLPDLSPPERDPVNLAGNHVVLDCYDAEVVLAHLKEGSVAVATGVAVDEGDVLGQVGNSGNTSQPHLHIHAERGGNPREILDGEGVPIQVGGRFLVRNDLFRGR